jgi:hypothetical protein
MNFLKADISKPALAIGLARVIARGAARAGRAAAAPAAASGTADMRRRRASIVTSTYA